MMLCSIHERLTRKEINTKLDLIELDCDKVMLVIEKPTRVSDIDALYEALEAEKLVVSGGSIVSDDEGGADVEYTLANATAIDSYIADKKDLLIFSAMVENKNVVLF